MQKQVKLKRKFSEDFKKKIVNDYETGKYTAIGISGIFDIPVTYIYKWIYTYSVYNKKKIRIVEMKDSAEQKIKEMQKRIKELEQIVGQKQIKIDYLEKMVEIAGEEFGLDIKKNFDTQQSIIFKHTRKK